MPVIAKASGNYTDNLLSEGLLLPLMEEFDTIQGEGFHTGKAAWFVRIGGCDVGCHWCDVKESWDASTHPLTKVESIIENAARSLSGATVITGGEPCTYKLDHLTEGLRGKGIKTYLETSGAYRLTGIWDWICLSPKKTGKPLSEFFELAHELKVIVYNKDDFNWAEENAAKMNRKAHLFLQPEWSKREEMIPLITEYVMRNPKWSVSLQTHKYLGIP